MREDRGSLSFELCNIGSSGRSDLVLFVSRVLRRVCFLILRFVHDGL